MHQKVIFLSAHLLRERAKTLSIMASEKNFMRILNMLAGVALLVGISVEVLTGNHHTYSSWYLWLQFVVCLIFILDFAHSLMVGSNSYRRIVPNMIFLLLSIPYLNIIHWLDLTPNRAVAVVLSALPLIRSFIAMGVVVEWLIESRISRIFGAYIFTVAGFTYLAALIFYDYEIGHNPHLNNFGNAFWWAWMNVTTVGAAIFPVTAIGKVLAVLLPSLGMMFFPIFTIYVTNLYTTKKKK